LVNRLMTVRLALARPLDLLVPSFVLDHDAAVRLLARSRARDAAVYGEWAALVLGLAPEVAYLECRGLDWETPDRHRRAVPRRGPRSARPARGSRRRSPRPGGWGGRAPGGCPSSSPTPRAARC